MLRLIKEPPATGAFCGDMLSAGRVMRMPGRKFRGAAGFGGRQLESINFTAGKVEILLAIIKFSA